MKQKLRLFTSLLLLAVASTAWGETVTYQHVFNTKPNTGNSIKLSGVNWNIEATNLGSYNSGNYAGVQIGSSKNNGSISLTSSENWNYQGKTKITEVRLWLNLGGTSVTPTVTIGGKQATSDGTTVVKNSSAGSDWTKTTKVTFTPADDGNTGVVVINVATVKAGYICAMEIDAVEEGGSTVETVATPTFSPEAGVYTSAPNVTISTDTQGATIYYTIDGENPTTSSNVYSSAINVSETTTIKAIAVKDGMDNSPVASATYAILGHAGTEADPYTVADARAAIDANTGITGVYATGIVSEIVTAYNSQHGNITFDIVDAEGNTQTIRAYRCAGDEAANVQEGDVVIVKGNLTKYNTTYEFAQGCEIVSRTSSSTQVAADLAFSANTASADLADLASFSAPTLLNPHSLAVTYASSKPEVATVDANGTVTILAEGQTTITATSEETEEYLAGTASYTLTVTNSNKQLVTVDADGNITFDLSDNGWGFPEGSNSITNDESNYTADGYTITLSGGGDGKGHYFNSTDNYLLMGQNGATLMLPAFNFPVEKIDVVGRANASGKVVQNIFVGETAVSTATTGATGTNTYVIAEDYKAAGNVYTLKVTSAHNTQITKIKVYKGTIDERANAEIAFSTESLTITQGKDYTAPSFSNPNNVDVTFTTDNADVASWDNGLVLGTATGTAVITATFDGNESYKPATAMLTVTVKEDLNFVDVVEGCGIYQKITSASDLEAGKRYLIVYENEDKAVIYNGQNGTNSYAGKADGDISGNKIDNTSVNAASIVLQRAGSNNWYLMDGDNFLYWNSGNTLEWTDDVNESDSWTIDVANGQIINAEQTDRRLQYNSGSPRFACYTGTQKDVVLYKELMEAPQPETITVTISDKAKGNDNYYYGTLYYGECNLVVPEGIVAYTYTVENGKMKENHSYEAEDVIPAGTGVLLKTERATEYQFTVTTDPGEVDDDNYLFGSDIDAQTNAGEGDWKYYKLTTKNGSNLGFYFGVEDGKPFTNGAHKAYLAVPAGQAPAKGFVLGEETTGINAIDNSQQAVESIYNLSGQRVQKATKGVYIVNGKKVVVK